MTRRDRAGTSRMGKLVWGAAWFAAVLLGVAVLGAGAARAVPPETLWTLQLLAVVLPHLAVALVVLAVVAGLGRRWRLVVFCLSPVGLLMLLAAISAESIEGPRDAGEAEAPWLRVMTFNAKPEAIGPGGEEALSALLAEEQPHLVALQEFPLRRYESGRMGGSTLLVPFLQGGTYQLVSTGRSGYESIGRPIFSRIEAVDPAELVPASLSEREGLWKSGGFTRALYRWNGTTIAVYSVHLHSFAKARPWQNGRRRALSPSAWVEAFRAYGDDFRIRAEQARILRRRLDAEPHPYLVCGDFNSTPGSWVYHHLSRGLRDAFAEAGSGWGATFPAQLPLVRIDYVLASPAWEVREARVEGGVASDHRPILAHLRLRAPGATGE